MSANLITTNTETLRESKANDENEFEIMSENNSR